MEIRRAGLTEACVSQPIRADWVAHATPHLKQRRGVWLIVIHIYYHCNHTAVLARSTSLAWISYSSVLNSCSFYSWSNFNMHFIFTTTRQLLTDRPEAISPHLA